MCEDGSTDLRPSGAWRCAMRGPDGTLHVARGVYREISPPTRVSFTHSWENEPGEAEHETLVSVELEDHGGKTRMRFRQTGLRSKASRDGHGEGWSEAFVHLEELVESGGEASPTGPGTKVTRTDDTLTLTRVFPATRELVWEAFTRPEHLTRWWGPEGFSTTTHAMDLRPGGEWRYTMHGPDGTNYENHVRFEQVVPLERVVSTHAGDMRDQPVCFRKEITFKTVAGGTRVTMRTTFPNPEMLTRVVDTYGALEGGKQTLSRLGAFLSSQVTNGPRPFVLSRVFIAPPEMVFKAWTTEAALKAWFGPKGMPISRCTLDLRPGGAFHYAMAIPNAGEMWGIWRFREIVAPERLVFVASFSNERGEIARAPFSDEWPLEVHSVVRFAPHAGKSGGTVVVMESWPINASAAELAAFESMHDSMTGGWSGTLEQLAAFLAHG